MEWEACGADADTGAETGFKVSIKASLDGGKTRVTEQPV